MEKLQSVEQELLALMNANKELRAERNLLACTNMEYQETIRRLQEEQAELQQIVRSSRDRVTCHNSELKRQINTLTEELEESQHKQAEAECKVRVLTKKIEHLSNELKQANARCEELAKEKTDVERANETLATKVISFKEAVIRSSHQAVPKAAQSVVESPPPSYSKSNNSNLFATPPQGTTTSESPEAAFRRQRAMQNVRNRLNKVKQEHNHMQQEVLSMCIRMQRDFDAVSKHLRLVHRGNQNAQSYYEGKVKYLLLELDSTRQQLEEAKAQLKARRRCCFGLFYC
eukprot:GEZU01022049.1.p1 GENE.GEZU01022049.1~~GEZU01022049.1.p1  ORF type:complete len:288 (-),score=47.59 GEZU01022049.1:118-981(-)